MAISFEDILAENGDISVLWVFVEFLSVTIIILESDTFTALLFPSDLIFISEEKLLFSYLNSGSPKSQHPYAMY